MTQLEMIARYMDLSIQLGMVEHPITGEYVDIDELQYHESFDWLMSVLDKIEIDNGDCASVECEGWNWYINLDGITIQGDPSPNSRLHGLYTCVLEYITWHNENK